MAELTRRYVVMPLATEAPFDRGDHDAPFVLKPWKDPAALAALRAYRDVCYPELARDLEAWIRTIAAGPAVRGDVGRRNEARARPARGGGRAPSGRKPGRRAARGRPTRAGAGRRQSAGRKKRR